jgi:hypothetical protein
MYDGKQIEKQLMIKRTVTYTTKDGTVFNNYDSAADYELGLRLQDFVGERLGIFTEIDRINMVFFLMDNQQELLNILTQKAHYE